MQKAPLQHKPLQSQSTQQQDKGASLESPQAAQITQLKAMAESSPQTMAQRRQMAQIHGSPRMAAQHKAISDLFNTSDVSTPQQPTDAPRPQVPAKANNTGLPDNLKHGIESLSGISMDNVRVHYNSAKPAQLKAHAYAQGSDIHIGPGQEQHLPHEAWHVVQQAQGRVTPTLQMNQGVPVNDDAGLEREADVMGAKAGAYLGDNSSLAPLTPAPLTLQVRSESLPLQAVFTHNNKIYNDPNSNMPNIHKVKSAELKKLAGSNINFGILKDRDDVESATTRLNAQNPPKKEKTPLLDSGKSFKVVATFPDHPFAFKDARSVDITCSLDWGQGKHDPHLKGARQKGGGTLVPKNVNYARSAQSVVLGLLQARLRALAETPEQEGHDFCIQSEEQSDKLHYEISAAWEVKAEGGYHILVYYHCYPTQ